MNKSESRDCNSAEAKLLSLVSLELISTELIWGLESGCLQSSADGWIRQKNLREVEGYVSLENFQK